MKTYKNSQNLSKSFKFLSTIRYKLFPKDLDYTCTKDSSIEDWDTTSYLKWVMQSWWWILTTSRRNFNEYFKKKLKLTCNIPTTHKRWSKSTISTLHVVVDIIHRLRLFHATRYITNEIGRKSYATTLCHEHFITCYTFSASPKIPIMSSFHSDPSNTTKYYYHLQ